MTKQRTRAISAIKFTLCLTALLCAACSPQKYLKEDESVLYSNHFEVKMLDGSPAGKEIPQTSASLSKYIRQTPNRRLLDIDRTAMHIYCLSSPSDSSWWGRMLRNTGEAPVVFKTSEASRSAKEIEKMLAAKGCFHSKATFDTLRYANRNISILYSIYASPRFKIKEIIYHSLNNEVDSILEQWRSQSPLKAGDYYDQDNITLERTLLASHLQESGYFYATPDLIQFYIDTSLADNNLSIDVAIRSPQRYIGDSIVRMPLQKYYFNKINIDSNAVSRNVISRNLNIETGNLFHPSDVSTSYNSLLNLHNFNYIDIQLDESPQSSDQRKLLDANIHLRNTTQQNLSISLEMSNASPLTNSDSGNFITNGNIGLETVISYQHKNLFGGAELLKIEGNLLFEFSKKIFRRNQVIDDKLVSTFESGLKASIDLPAFLVPFRNKISQRITLPHTLFNIGLSYQFRAYFERMQFNTSFGYTWNINNRSFHQILPIELTFVRIMNISEDYSRILSEQELNQRIAYQYSDHFIMGTRYDFIRNTQQFGTRNNFTYIHASAETAGNLLSLTAPFRPEHKGILGQNQIFNVPYEQYIRTTAEIKRYIYHGLKSTLVLRFMAGIGLPYGNSFNMPYEKSFFGGGPNNIRAWQIRQLGPGGYCDNGLFAYSDRTGDISLVANIEERFPILGPLEGAAFVDMGNVWFANKSDIYTDSWFDFKTFYKQIAIGAGIGLRLKVYILTLRVDFAIPIYHPNIPDNKWRFKHLKFNQIVTNFGIDYPF